MEKKRILTGDRPTGRLHIGHYFGSLKTRLEESSKNYEKYKTEYEVLSKKSFQEKSVYIFI